MVFNKEMLDKLKNSDIAIHLKNDYYPSFGDNENTRLIGGGFEFCTDKFICVQNNKKQFTSGKLKPFFIFINIDDIITIELMPHED